MQPPGVRHLGFLIPLPITMSGGQLLRRPGSGKCFRCLRTRQRTYVLFDDRCICEECIAFDYAEKAHGLGGQRRPAADPVEIVYEQSPVRDKFDDRAAFWNRELDK